MQNRFDDIRRMIAALIEKNEHDQNILKEALTRITTLGTQYTSLMDLNEAYIKLDPQKIDMEFDEQNDTMNFFQKGKLVKSLKLRRANSNKPIKIASKSSLSTFTPEYEDDSKEIQIIRREIARNLESFYYNANKLFDLIEKDLFSKKKKKNIGIVAVRNKLIEHTEKGDIYSFGVSEETGPVVKPTKLILRKEKFNDPGLIKNTKQFLILLKSRLENL